MIIREGLNLIEKWKWELKKVDLRRGRILQGKEEREKGWYDNRNINVCTVD